jgi:integrase/recombinase XerD
MYINILGGLYIMLLDDSVKEFIFECQIRQYTWKTVKGYKNTLEYLATYLKEVHHLTDIEQVNEHHLKAFFAYQINKKCKETYLNGLIKVYRAFYKYLVEQEYVVKNPILKVSWMHEPTNIIKTFSDEEVKRMLSVYPETDYLNIRNKAIMAMLFDTGIRNYELCCLPNDNIKDNYIAIYGKGKKERQVGKSPYLSKILMKYERVKKYYFEFKNVKLDNYFLSRTGRPLTNEAVGRIVHIAGEQAKISDTIRCSPHTCRHWFAQSQIKNGIDVYSLSRLMGHSNIKVTQRYLEGMRDNQIVSQSIKTSPLMNL